MPRQAILNASTAAAGNRQATNIAKRLGVKAAAVQYARQCWLEYEQGECDLVLLDEPAATPYREDFIKFVVDLWDSDVLCRESERMADDIRNPHDRWLCPSIIKCVLAFTRLIIASASTASLTTRRGC